MRKDYFRDLWTYVAPGRGERKFEVENQEKNKSSKECFFCPGNEDQTPPEITRIKKGKGWQARVFDNKFPIIGGEDEYFPVWETGKSYGRHEIIVETPDHSKDVTDIDNKDFIKIFKLYQERITEAEKDPEISYVQVFKNYGSLGGASLEHSHTQLIATSQIPKQVSEKIARSKEGDCIYCWMVGVERDSARLVAENESAIAFVPFAPSFEYEVWIMPKNHCPSIDKASEQILSDMADMLSKLLKRVKSFTDSYNYLIFYGPRGGDFHFHIEIIPRIPHTVKAGFELGTGYSVITSTPENMAEHYRRELA